MRIVKRQILEPLQARKVHQAGICDLSVFEVARLASPLDVVAKAYYSAPPKNLALKVGVRWDVRLVRIFNHRCEQIAVHIAHHLSCPKLQSFSLWLTAGWWTNWVFIRASFVVAWFLVLLGDRLACRSRRTQVPNLDATFSLFVDSRNCQVLVNWCDREVTPLCAMARIGR